MQGVIIIWFFRGRKHPSLVCTAPGGSVVLQQQLEKSTVNQAVLSALGSSDLVTSSPCSLIDERLGLGAFEHFAGILSGYLYVKVVWDLQENKIHFINYSKYSFHSDYIALEILSMSEDELLEEIDSFNQRVYLDSDRRFYLGIIALHKREKRKIFTLETVEIDNMNDQMVQSFYSAVKEFLDPLIPFYFKPANHLQEQFIKKIDAALVPRLLHHELFAYNDFLALNEGKTQGRIRWFNSTQEFQKNLDSIQWFDIVVMKKVPENVPRLAGIINASHTTPLSHTNVLATGWQIPNCIQLGIEDEIINQQLDGKWVDYQVSVKAKQIYLKKIATPDPLPQTPSWSSLVVKMEEPETSFSPISNLTLLRKEDRFRFGTKAAHLGELFEVLKSGSSKLIDFYQIPRPPRPNLMPYLLKFFKTSSDQDLKQKLDAFIQKNFAVPKGIAIPFSIQQKFLQSQPQIQQQIGKLKMALELNAREIEPICVRLQQMILSSTLSKEFENEVRYHLNRTLLEVENLVVRSSSNAEDLNDFSAAGIYESLNHVTTTDKVFDGIKKVWASLISPRSVRMRQQVGISLDDCYMGVVIQEELPVQMGGVLVTSNPMNRDDFRNVYMNVAIGSVNQVVDGSEDPYQFLYNVVEGGGRTLSLGKANEDLSWEYKQILQKIAFAGKFLESHFQEINKEQTPVDIEWAYSQGKIYILQIRPYAR